MTEHKNKPFSDRQSFTPEEFLYFCEVRRRFKRKGAWMVALAEVWERGAPKVREYAK